MDRTTSSPPVPPLRVAAVAALAAFALYTPALRNGFVWDDPIVLEQLRHFRHAKDFFFQPDVVPKFYYRPVTFLSFAWDQLLGGHRPFFFHLTNLLLHAANSSLAALILLRLPGLTAPLPALAAYLFAVHPVHVEAVAWVAGRADLLAALFILLATLVALRTATTIGLCCLTLLYFAALLCKETALGLLAVLPFLDRTLGRPWQWRREILLLTATAFYLLLRAANIGSVLGGHTQDLSLDATLPELARGLGLYLAHAFVPGLTNPYMPAVPSSPAVVVGAIACLALGGLAWVSAPANKRLFVFFAVWFFSFLGPVALIFFRKSATTLVADRYLYLPSLASCAGLVLAITAVISRLPSRPRASIALWGLLLTGSALATLWKVPVWQDNLSFWSAAQAAAPQDPIANRELGLAVLERDQPSKAKPWLEKAWKLSRTGEEKAMAASNLASLYRRSGDFAAAVALLRDAIGSAPHPALFHNLGMTLMSAAEQAQREGRTAEVAANVLGARDAFQRALDFLSSPQASAFRPLWDPAKTHSLLGQVYWSLGQRERAREHLRAALRLAPTGPIAEATRRYWSQAFPGEALP